MTRRSSRRSTCLVSTFEPKTIFYAHENEDWIFAMNKEIEQIERNKTWSLVPKPKDKKAMGINWVFSNKLDENGEVTRNKARLVYKGYA